MCNDEPEPEPVRFATTYQELSVFARATIEISGFTVIPEIWAPQEPVVKVHD